MGIVYNDFRIPQFFKERHKRELPIVLSVVLHQQMNLSPVSVRVRLCIDKTGTRRIGKKL
jgi:hypothetical protein